MEDKQQNPTLRDHELEGGDYTLVAMDFWRSTKYSLKAKAVYTLLTMYVGENGVACPEQELLASQLDISENSLRAALKELEEAGLISIRRQGLGKPNCYVIH
jgi:hypothetical protein